MPPLDEALLAALGELPGCAGVAVGVDRLVALAIGLDEVAAAMSFAHPRGERGSALGPGSAWPSASYCLTREM